MQISVHAFRIDWLCQDKTMHILVMSRLYTLDAYGKIYLPLIDWPDQTDQASQLFPNRITYVRHAGVYV